MALTVADKLGISFIGTVDSVITPPLGAVPQGNKVVIAFEEVVSGSSAPPVPTPPAGFGLVQGTWPADLTSGGQRGQMWVWEKPAGASEPTSYTITHASVFWQAIFYSIGGGPDGTTASVASSSASTGTVTTWPTITSPANNCLVLGFGFDGEDSANVLTPPSGTTPTFTADVNPGGGVFAASGPLATAGATGNKTFTNNSDAGDFAFGAMIAIRPAAPAAPAGGFFF